MSRPGLAKWNTPISITFAAGGSGAAPASVVPRHSRQSATPARTVWIGIIAGASVGSDSGSMQVGRAGFGGTGP